MSNSWNGSNILETGEARDLKGGGKKKRVLEGAGKSEGGKKKGSVRGSVERHARISITWGLLSKAKSIQTTGKKMHVNHTTEV